MVVIFYSWRYEEAPEKETWPTRLTLTELWQKREKGRNEQRREGREGQAVFITGGGDYVNICLTVNHGLFDCANDCVPLCGNFAAFDDR